MDIFPLTNILGARSMSCLRRRAVCEALGRSFRFDPQQLPIVLAGEIPDLLAIHEHWESVGKIRQFSSVVVGCAIILLATLGDASDGLSGPGGDNLRQNDAARWLIGRLVPEHDIPRVETRLRRFAARLVEHHGPAIDRIVVDRD